MGLVAVLLLWRRGLLGLVESAECSASIDDSSEMRLKLWIGEAGKLAEASKGERVAR